MNVDELQQAKAKARRMREELDRHELPQPMEAGLCKYGKAPVRPNLVSARVNPMGQPQSQLKSVSSMPPPLQASASSVPGAPSSARGLAPLAPMAPNFAMPAQRAAPSIPVAPAAAPVAPSSSEEESKRHLMRQLVQLTPEQIAKLPEGTKVQLLQFLQQ